MRARLDDAKFFWEEDLKRPLEDFVERLSTVTFQERLGTVLQKVQRMEAIAAEVARRAGASERDTAYAKRAAHLADTSLGYKSDEGIKGDAERSLLEA